MTIGPLPIMSTDLIELSLGIVDKVGGSPKRSQI